MTLDVEGWNRIYQEFRPKKIRLENKIYKFDLETDIGYNYRYSLCRILHEKQPKKILEFHFDQVTKMVAQCAQRYQAEHTVITNYSKEQVRQLVDHWGIHTDHTVVFGSPLLLAHCFGKQGVVFQEFQRITNEHRYHLIILKSSSTDAYIHLDILQNLPDLLMDDFVILMDHVETECGNMIVQFMGNILKQRGVSYVKKNFNENQRVVCALMSISWKDVAAF